METSDYFLALTYIAYVAAPALRDELWLRCAFALNSLGFVIWGAWIGNEVVIIFNGLFFLISTYHIRRLAGERREITLEGDEGAVHATLFRGLRPRRFLLIWDLGATETVEGTLTTSGEPVDEMMILLEGRLRSPDLGFEVVAPAPAFIGEMSLVTGEPASATLVADGPVRVRRFPHDTLRNLEAQHPDLSHALLGGVAQGLAGKVRRDNG